MNPNFNFSRISRATLFLASVCLFAAACSRGGTSIQRTEYCENDYAPLKVGEANKYREKIILKTANKNERESDSFSPLPVEFKYAGMDLYFEDTARDFKIHLRQRKDLDSGEVSKLEVVCAGGKAVTQNMDPISYSFTFISDMYPEETSLIKVKTKTVSFDLRPRPSGKTWLAKSITDSNGGYVVGNPRDFHENFETQSIYFLNSKTSAERYTLLNLLENKNASRKPKAESKLIIKSQVLLYTDYKERW
jgi:hypothetical protein